MTSQTFNLDLIPQGVPPIVHVSQYDKGQTWNIHLLENGVVFPVPSGTSAAVQGTKPDNTGFQYPAVISVGDNVVTFTVEQQMTVLGGQFECELVLVNGENQVATINFILDVEPTTLDDDTVISETQLPLIEQAAELGAVINNYATQIHADAETANTAATAATSAAESTAADAATATQAADDAQAGQTAAASSASNAATSETNAAASATAAASSASNATTSEANAAASATAAASSASTAESAAQTAQGAMNGKLSTYTDDSTQWDATPTAGSTKPVTSGGVKAQFDSIGTQIADINEEIADLHTEDSRLSSQISKIATLERITTATGVQYACRMGRIGFFTFEAVLTNATNGTVICSGLPRPQSAVYCSFMTITNLAVPCTFDIDGTLKVYYPNTTISGRVDGSLMYFITEENESNGK